MYENFICYVSSSPQNLLTKIITQKFLAHIGRFTAYVSRLTKTIVIFSVVIKKKKVIICLEVSRRREKT